MAMVNISEYFMLFISHLARKLTGSAFPAEVSWPARQLAASVDRSFGFASRTEMM